jgi:O-antigen/teichoic acid export membrane protein
VVTRVVSGVMYPALSEAGRLDGPGVSDFYYRLRKRLDLLSMSSAGFLAAMGGWFVHLLWDRRYGDAAWILQILCVRTAMTLMVSPTETCLFSLGHTRYGFLRSMTRLLGSLVCLPIGWHVAGIKGVIWGTVVTEFLTFFAVWPKIISLGIFRIRNELRAVGIFAAAFGLGLLVRHFLPDIQIHLHHHG